MGKDKGFYVKKQKIRDKLYFICSYLSAFSSVHNKICKTNNHDYGVSTNLYSLNENGEIVRENLQKILSVLAAHQIILWEYDILTGKCSFTDDYFRTLGLKEAGMVFKDINDFYRFAHPDDMDACQKSFAAMLTSESKTSQIRVRCIGEHKEVIWLEDHFLSYKGNDETHPDKLLAYTVNVTIPRKYMICLFTISMSIAPFEGNKVLVLIHDISDRICRSRKLIETKRWQKTPIS